MQKFLAIYDPVDLEYVHLIINEHDLNTLQVVDGQGENLLTGIVCSNNKMLWNRHTVEKQLLVVKEVLDAKNIYNETQELQLNSWTSFITNLDHNGDFTVMRKPTTDAYFFDLNKTSEDRVVLVNRYQAIEVDGIYLVGEHNAVRSVRRFIKYRVKQNRIFNRQILDEIVERADCRCKVYARTMDNSIIDITKAEVVDREGYSLGRLDAIVGGYTITNTVWNRAHAAWAVDKWDVLAYKLKPAAFIK